MAVYQWRGINAGGKNVKGVQDADSPKALKTQLRRDGVMVTEILEESVARKKRAREVDLKKVFRPVRASDVGTATQQLATLLKAGIPLVEALSALIDQLEHPELKAAFTQTRDRVNEGSSFADALKQHPKIFSGLYVSMVAAGEASGTLEVVLARLSDFLEKQARLSGKVIGAIAYPMIMMTLSLLIIVILMVVVVPQVTSIFENFGKELPWYTNALIFVSNIFVNFWWLLIILLAGGIYGFVRWKRTEEGRKKWDRFVLKAPLFGKLLVMVAVARFARTLATLLQSGVPVLRSMEITSHVLGNTELVRVVEEARASVREGDSLATPLKKSGRFPPIVTHMIAIGERSGQLEQMLEKVAEAYDVQVELRTNIMTSLLNPLIIVVMGVILGSIVFSVMMPLVQINEFIQ